MVSSLENLCVIPSLVVLSNHPDVKETIFSTSINSLKSSSERDDWIRALQSKGSEILKENRVPTRIIKWHLLPFIGIEMLKWATHLQTQFNLPIEFIKDFIKSSFFEVRGLLDEQKAVRELVNEPSLSVFLQYKIACHYCLRDVALRLWQQFCNTDSEFQSIFIEYHYINSLVLWSEYFKKTESSSTPGSELETHLIYDIYRDFLVKRNFSAVKSMVLSESRSTLGGQNLFNYIEYALKMHLLPELNKNCNSLWEMQLSRDVSIHRDIMLNYSHLNDLKENKNFLCLYNLLKYFLVWPYQDYFMKTAVLIFDILSEDHFYCLMQNIVNATMDPNLSRTFNYRHLLREFWIKSDSNHKQYVLKAESNESYENKIRMCCNVCLDSNLYLLEKIITSNNFSRDDEINFKLIIENATWDDKEDILKLQGESCISDLLLKYKFEIVDMYFNTLTTRENIQSLIIKPRASWFIRKSLLEKERFDMSDKFVNWIVSPDEVDNLKKEIFHKVFRFSDVARAFLSSEIPLSHLDKLLEWFGKTEEEIKEWKTKCEFDYRITRYFFNHRDNSCLKQFDNLFKCLDYTEQKRSKIKNKILEEKTSFAIILSLFTSDRFKNSLYEKLLYLCSNNEERVRKYVIQLEAFAKNNIKRYFSENYYCIPIETDTSSYKFKSNEVKKMFSNLKIFKEQILKDRNENI